MDVGDATTEPFAHQCEHQGCEDEGINYFTCTYDGQGTQPPCRDFGRRIRVCERHAAECRSCGCPGSVQSATSDRRSSAVSLPSDFDARMTADFRKEFRCWIEIILFPKNGVKWWQIIDALEDQDEGLRTLQIAKSVIGPAGTKKDVNATLYLLQKVNAIKQTCKQPPRWSAIRSKSFLLEQVASMLFQVGLIDDEVKMRIIHDPRYFDLQNADVPLGIRRGAFQNWMDANPLPS